MAASLASCDIPADWILDFSQCLYEWQGIEAGVLALIAAVIGAIFLHRQFLQNERHEAQRLARQHKAVRATFPLTLSGICETMRQMILALDEAKRVIRTQGYTKDFIPPSTPDRHVNELQLMISSTDERSVLEPIAQIIREIQTLWARIEVLSSKTQQRRRAGLVINVNSWILQASEIHAMAESLFEYARSEDETGPCEVAWERVESVIFQLGIEDKEIVDEIKKVIEKSPNYWTLDD